jgi:hypothetical protein
VRVRNGAPARTGILHSRYQGQISGLTVLFSISHHLASSSLDKLFVQRQTCQFSKWSYFESLGTARSKSELVTRFTLRLAFRLCLSSTTKELTRDRLPMGFLRRVACDLHEVCWVQGRKREYPRSRQVRLGYGEGPRNFSDRDNHQWPSLIAASRTSC